MKTCSRCKIEKPKTDFYLKSKRNPILRPECIACGKIKKEKLRRCYRCDKEFMNGSSKQFCSNECRYTNTSEQMKFLHEHRESKGVGWHQ